MSQSLTKQQPSEQTIAVRIALNGNLAALTEPQIWEYYQQMCAALELDPLSRPFDVLEGTEGTGDNKTLKKVLYPNSSCSAQLANKRRITFGPVKIEAEQGLASIGMKVARVSVECALPNGRKLVGEAFIDLVGKYGPLTGKNLENALKKAATQARRRGTLQLCGLTLPQEEENQQITILGEIEDEPEPIEMLPGGNAGALSAGEESEPETDADREAFEQEQRHRDVEEQLKQVFLAAGKAEGEWEFTYHDMELADKSVEEKRTLLGKWQARAAAVRAA